MSSLCAMMPRQALSPAYCKCHLPPAPSRGEASALRAAPTDSSGRGLSTAPTSAAAECRSPGLPQCPRPSHRLDGSRDRRTEGEMVSTPAQLDRTPMEGTGRAAERRSSTAEGCRAWGRRTTPAVPSGSIQGRGCQPCLAVFQPPGPPILGPGPLPRSCLFMTQLSVHIP